MATSTPVLSAPLAEQVNGVSGLLLHIPKNAHTHAGFRKWVLADCFPENVRVTFLRGEVYLDMSKQEVDNHVGVKGEVYRVVGNLNHELDAGLFYTDGVLVTNLAAGVSNNPGGVGILWETLEAERVRLVKKKAKVLEIEGSPDWALEVVSDGSVDKDCRLLRDAYHKAHIQEYWLIDARGQAIDFQILHWRRGGYAAAPNRDGWQRSRIFDRSFQLVRKLDRAGMWTYTLLVQE